MLNHTWLWRKRLAPVALILLLVSACPVFSAAAEGFDASSLLKAAGIQGGLVVHLGCGDGKTTASLFAGDGFLVQGLDPRAANVAAARSHIRSLGSYGRVSVDLFDGIRLPYADDIVNLLLVESDLHVPAEEIVRVLVPRGIVLFRDPPPAFPEWTGSKVEGWTAYVKPIPADIDEWTH